MADTWTWSADHQDYYRYTNENGPWEIHWAKQTHQQGGVLSDTRRDSFVQPPTLPNPGLQHGEALTNNSHYTPASQGYAPPSISAHYTVDQAYSTAPNYPSGGGAYAGSTSLPTPQAAEQQPPPDQRRPYAYQRDQYGQPQQEYLTTTPGRLQRQTSNAEPPPRQPESTTAGGPTEEIPLSAIRGTPGEAETLDPEYRVQNSRFFKKGKMFAILFSEPLGNDTQQLDNANVSTVIYNQHVYSQIRRFVVVQERRGFCYAWFVHTWRSCYDKERRRAFGACNHPHPGHKAKTSARRGDPREKTHCGGASGEWRKASSCVTNQFWNPAPHPA